MKVKEIMTEKVVTVQMDYSLRAIREIFNREKFHHILVVYKGVLQGVISDRDVFKNLSPYIGKPGEQIRDTATLRKPAHQIMTRDLVTATPDTPVADAALVFVQKHISCLPVVDAEKNVLGIVTWKDILKASLREAGMYHE